LSVTVATLNLTSSPTPARTALWRLVETLDPRTAPGRGRDPCRAGRRSRHRREYLCFEFLGAQPQLELYAELREALAAAHAEAIAAGLGKRGQVALVRTERPH
jgi:hypothetical protein